MRRLMLIAVFLAFLLFLSVRFSLIILHLSVLLKHGLRSSPVPIVIDRERPILVRFLKYHVVGVYELICVLVLLLLSVVDIIVLNVRPLATIIRLFLIVEEGLALNGQTI